MDMCHKLNCSICNEIIGRVKFPWDAGGGEQYYCLKCKPLTKEEKEALEYAKWKKKKVGVRG